MTAPRDTFTGVETFEAKLAHALARDPLAEVEALRLAGWPNRRHPTAAPTGPPWLAGWQAPYDEAN